MTTVVMTLLFLRREDQILLAMKKRGFGKGRWNGVGGKLDPGETIEQALLRECQEEIMVTPRVYEKVAEHEFLEQHDGTATHMLVHTYVCTAWDGQPIETEEMAPQWFAVDAIPYATMWPDDPLWLPQVLEGKKLKTFFDIDEHNVILNSRIQEVEDL